MNKTRDVINLLIEISQWDDKIYQINLSIQSHQKEKQSLQQSSENFDQAVSRLKKDVFDLKSSVNDIETNIEKSKEKISSYNVRLNSIRTNEEYRQTLDFIEEEKNNIELFETSLLEKMDLLEMTELSLKEEKTILDEKHQGIQKRYSEIDDYIDRYNKEKELLNKDRQVFVDQLFKMSREVYEEYLNLIKKYPSGVLSRLNGDNCGFCQMEVLAMNSDQIKLNSRLIQCEYCRKVLYILDEEE